MPGDVDRAAAATVSGTSSQCGRRWSVTADGPGSGTANRRAVYLAASEARLPLNSCRCIYALEYILLFRVGAARHFELPAGPVDFLRPGHDDF